MKHLRSFLASCAVVCAVTSLTPSLMAKETDTVLDHKVKDIAGKPVDLSEYKGKVLLVVNVASKCGNTPQYEQLEALYEAHKGDGLVVMGFPCNQFGGQEPGTEAKIQEFCSATYGVTFPMFSKVEVNGSGADPFYKELTATEAAPVGKGDVKWNFEKFVIGRDGQVVGRFGARVKPDAPEVVAALKKALAEKPAE